MRENCNTFSPGNWQQLLSQNFNLHNTKQAEVLLSQQEHLFSKDETSTNLEQAKTLIIKKKV